VGTPVGFDLAVLILRVLEGWELGIAVYIGNTGHI
jgi:hypothetical protein